MKSIIYVNNHTGKLVGENYPNTTRFISMDLYEIMERRWLSEREINKALRKALHDAQGVAPHGNDDVEMVHIAENK